ncbi:MAG: phosphatidylinositol mannoside acyltransferase [Actinomycetota bacterium]|nr:phosphatidylinositol mannoside acyltransferase [Actinomycetota bacterium]
MKIQYYMFLFGQKLISFLPIRLSRAVARAGGTLYYHLFPRKREQVIKNMRRALGPEASEREVKRTAPRACRYYAEYWVDILWLPTRTREYILERFVTIDEGFLIQALDRGRGVLIILPHYGSWEAGGVYMSSLGPFAAVAEVLRPQELFDLFVDLRKGVGIEILPYDRSPLTRDRMVEMLGDGYMLALLCDRDLKGTGVEVEFFGESTTLPPGPAVLARRSGAPIVCVNVRNLDDGTWVGKATSPIWVKDGDGRDRSIEDTMQEVAHRLEDLIRDDPAQWHMFMPCWPSDRESM